MAREPLTIVSLFSGIGSMELGLEHALCARTVLQVEQNPFCRAVLAKHWPSVARLEDVSIRVPTGRTTDVLCGGFPCQPHSAAGARLGTDDARWLWPEMHAWIQRLAPRAVVIENVPGLLTSSGGEAFSQVLSDLHDWGYDARWRTISAADVGAPHRRKRVVIVALRRDEEPMTDLPRAVCADWGHAGWPARPDQPQESYEPAPVVALATNRRHRLHALGNVMVPQVAYEAGMMARYALEGGWARTPAAGKVIVVFDRSDRHPQQPSLIDASEAPCPRWPRHGAMTGGAVQRLSFHEPAALGAEWPTPRASESEMRTYAPAPTHGSTHGKQLQAEVIARYGDPTAPAAGCARPDIGALNPDWVELLVGLPMGWTKIDVDMGPKRRAARRKGTKITEKEGT